MEILNQINSLTWHATRRWGTRDISRVNKIIIHQELGEGDVSAVNNYHIKPNHISSKGCPHFCYHFGIEEKGEIIQANELSNITWHTKGQNKYSVGIMLVGNFAGPGHTAGTREPTQEQIDSLLWLTNYLKKALNLSNQDVYGHYHFGKPACPGTIIQNWIENLRNNITPESGSEPVEKTAKEIQKRLNKLGYACGTVDGVIGIKTLTAIRKFQKDNGLIIDGIVGPQTWKKLIALT